MNTDAGIAHGSTVTTNPSHRPIHFAQCCTTVAVLTGLIGRRKADRIGGISYTFVMDKRVYSTYFNNP
jgi:hypothetical protein